MLNSYQDGCPINESHVFYAATNTFRNPIFEPQIDPDFEEAGQARTPAVHCSPLIHPEQQQQQQQQQHQQKQSATCPEVEVEMVRHERGAATGDQQSVGPLKMSCSNNASFSSNQSELGQRWQDFSDNLSLSIRGRLFVMESNFKRRLRAIRKYVDKKMPWILPLVGKYHGHSEQREKQRAKGSGTVAGQLDRFNFPEPSSARALDAQQECLLNRLERIKREHLFRLPAESLDIGHSEAHHQGDGANFEYIDNSSAESRAVPLQAAAELQPAPVLLEDGAKPLSLFSAIGQSAKADRSKPPGKRSRWISRSGRHIRDTALAFTSSKRSCIVCYERAPNIVTLPCEHSDICSDCFIEIIYMAVKHKQYPLRCVLCRQKVERIRCSRRLLLSVIEKNRLR